MQLRVRASPNRPPIWPATSECREAFRAECRRRVGCNAARWSSRAARRCRTGSRRSGQRSRPGTGPVGRGLLRRWGRSPGAQRRRLHAARGPRPDNAAMKHAFVDSLSPPARSRRCRRPRASRTQGAGEGEFTRRQGRSRGATNFGVEIRTRRPRGPQSFQKSCFAMASDARPRSGPNKGARAHPFLRFVPARRHGRTCARPGGRTAEGPSGHEHFTKAGARSAPESWRQM